MANLAIRGHTTRSKEVIEILEMLGGVNKHGYTASCEGMYFYILRETKFIYFDWCSKVDEYTKILTLEEFLEKFPYKVGDRVKKANDDDGYGATIISVDWDSVTSEVVYTIILDDHIGSTLKCLSVNLQPYKEETFGECIAKAIDICLFGEQKTMEEQIKIDIPEGYEISCIDKQQILLKKIKPKYPKTYEECCQYLGCDDKIKMQLIGQFTQLINARNAYWKIAGEQMGLGKPWSPSKNDDVYCIFRLEGEIVKDNFVFADSLILEFPTEEMRDKFYENFKDLIEQCKELL